MSYSCPALLRTRRSKVAHRVLNDVGLMLHTTSNNVNAYKYISISVHRYVRVYIQIAKLQVMVSSSNFEVALIGRFPSLPSPTAISDSSIVYAGSRSCLHLRLCTLLLQ